MDLKQRKLNKSEWQSIEIKLPENEINILKLITTGFHDVNIRINHTPSILSFLKIEYSEKMENYIYDKYLKNKVEALESKFQQIFTDYKFIKNHGNTNLKSADKIRLSRLNEDDIEKAVVYEMVLLDLVEKILKENNAKNTKLFHYYYYTIYKLIRNNITYLNKHLVYFIHEILNKFEEQINKSIIIENAVEFIEKNQNILKFNDLVLYEHQKKIFTLLKNKENETNMDLYDVGTPCVPKLILYMAPTGTGKTLTPLALSEQKKIIFVCAARHVGLALARAAISIDKKVAFAFGCSSADDIRLHYFAAKDYTLSKRTGGIKKVDNSVGDNVQIMISDVRSYTCAMYYMLAFFPANDIVTYWDEPTISMDYSSHEFHEIIHNNWKENTIPTVVLSSATLPKENELTETIPDFLNKFPGAEIHNIVSHDCKKSIPIINKDGYVVLPHLLSDNYNQILDVANHCSNYLTLLRYFDLREVVEFISFVNKHNYANHKMNIERHFDNIDSIDMTNIKIYYIELLKNIQPEKWTIISSYFKQIRKPRIFENETVDTKGNKIQKIRSLGPTVSLTTNKMAGAPITRLSSEQLSSKTTQSGTCGVYVTTKDAYTLTDGPTIFISNDIEKIAKFCVQQANIPSIVMDEIMDKIEHNNAINEEINKSENELEEIKNNIDKQVKNKISEHHGGSLVTGRTKSNKDSKKISKDIPDEFQNRGDISKLTERINMLRSMIKIATLNETFVPNKKNHLEKWAQLGDNNTSFTSNVDEQIVADIMALHGVDNLWKVLLMMGIGVFINHDNITYTEIMKKLADEQKLYMIIASSDYIYGTNYQFCHGFLSKDLDLTQEKIIQAMGRIGRNNIQQQYTIRFRDDLQIAKLFTNNTEKPEVVNMNKLFNSRD